MAETETTNDGIYLVKELRDFINSNWESKPASLMLERFAKTPPSITIQQLSGAMISRKYVDGSYVGNFPFGIFVRVRTDSTANTMSAISALTDLYEWLVETDADDNFKHLPTLNEKTVPIGFEITSLPSLVARYEEGYEDYSALFSFNYKKRR